MVAGHRNRERSAYQTTQRRLGLFENAHLKGVGLEQVWSESESYVASSESERPARPKSVSKTGASKGFQPGATSKS